MKKKKTFLKRIIGICVSIAMMLSITSVVAYAAEPEETPAISFEDITNDEVDGDFIEEIDPNIIVTVTEMNEPMCMPMSFYSSYFDFHGSLKGKYRYFDGNHIGAELSTSSEKSGKNFTLRLVRNGKTVAKANLPQNGNFHVDFTNINKPSDYAFWFSQSGLGSTHQWGSINMFSWN